MSLLISTVLSGSRNRLAPLVDAPCTMPGNVAAMLGLDDQHVAAVPLGDDLILQVLRGVLAAQVRLERAAQAAALLAQPIADASQLGTGIVDHVARRVDLFPRVAPISLLNDATPALATSSRGKTPRRSPDRQRAPRRPSRERRPAPAAAAVRAPGPRPRARRESAAGRSTRAAGKRRVASRYCAVSVVAASSCATLCGSVAGASRARRSSPIGVSAKLRTASTMRSNSSARRTPGSIIGLKPRTVRRMRGTFNTSITEAPVLWLGARPEIVHDSARSHPPPSPKPPAAHKMVDQAGDAGGAESVVDVDDRRRPRRSCSACRAARRCRRSWRRSRPRSARRSPGTLTSPETTLGSAPSIPATTMMTRAASRRCAFAEQAVESGDADVVEAVDLVAHELGGAARLLRRPAGRTCPPRRPGSVPFPARRPADASDDQCRLGMIGRGRQRRRAPRRRRPGWRA